MTDSEQRTPDELVEQHTKDELLEQAHEQDIDVKSADTKQDIAEKLSSTSHFTLAGSGGRIFDENGEQVHVSKVPAPVRVDGRSKRSDDDGLEGGPVKIVKGEFKDRVGVFYSVVSYSLEDGYPHEILVRTKDDEREFLSVPYEHVRPVEKARNA